MQVIVSYPEQSDLQLKVPTYPDPSLEMQVCPFKSIPSQTSAFSLTLFPHPEIIDSCDLVNTFDSVDISFFSEKLLSFPHIQIPVTKIAIKPTKKIIAINKPILFFFIKNNRHGILYTF